MTQDILIRDMERPDREGVTDLLLVLNRFEDALSHDRATDRAGAASCLRDDEEKVREHGGLHLVADGGGRILGYMCCAITHGAPYLRPDVRIYVYVHTLVVAEAARGAGIGEKLMRAAEDFARAQGVRSLVVAHLAGNHRAARLYEKLGLRAHAVDRVKWLD